MNTAAKPSSRWSSGTSASAPPRMPCPRSSATKRRPPPAPTRPMHLVSFENDLGPIAPRLSAQPRIHLPPPQRHRRPAHRRALAIARARPALDPRARRLPRLHPPRPRSARPHLLRHVLQQDRRRSVDARRPSARSSPPVRDAPSSSSPTPAPRPSAPRSSPPASTWRAGAAPSTKSTPPSPSPPRPPAGSPPAATHCSAPNGWPSGAAPAPNSLPIFPPTSSLLSSKRSALTRSSAAEISETKR